MLVPQGLDCWGKCVGDFVADGFHKKEKFDQK